MIWSVLKVARWKSGACDDADRRCALRCPTRLQGRIRRAWIKGVGSAGRRDASRRDPPCCSVLCKSASLLCSLGCCQPSWSGGFAIGWRVGGDDGDQRRHSVYREWVQNSLGFDERMYATGVSCRKGGCAGECRKNSLGCAMRTRIVEARKV